MESPTLKIAEMSPTSLEFEHIWTDLPTSRLYQPRVSILQNFDTEPVSHSEIRPQAHRKTAKSQDV